MKDLKRILATVLCFVLLISVMGAAALAVGEEPTAQAATEAEATETVLADAPETTSDDAAAVESEEADETVTVEEAEGKKESKLKSVFRSELYVKANEDAGVDSDIKVDLDLTGGTGTLYLPGKADVSKLTYSWDSKNVVLVQGKNEYKSGEAPVAASGKKVTYKIKNGLAFAYLTVKTMQGSADVEPMYLTIDESLGTIKAMNGDGDHETSCYGSVSFGDNFKAMSIKGRGNSTWDMPKKPYNMTLYTNDSYSKKEKTELIKGKDPAKKWTLLANYFDNALIRNKIAFDLAKDMGIGLDSQFVDLWMNGEYLGNYMLCQKKDYKKPDKGFILENDHIPDSSEIQFDFPGMHNMPLKHNLLNIDLGDDLEKAGVAPEEVQDWFTQRWNTVYDYDSEDYQEYFDLDSWAKMYLMFEVSKTYDCYAGNIIMSVKNMAKGDKIVAGPAWDYDIAFGRTLHKFLVGVSEPIQVNAEGWYNDSIGYLITGDKPVTMLQELGKHASFMQHVAKIYTQYRSNFEDLAADVDEQAAVIEDSAMMDRDLMGLINLSAEYVVAPNTMKLLGSGKYKLNYKITTGWSDYIYNLKEYCTKRVMWMTDHLYVEAPEGSITTKAREDGGVLLTAALTAGADNVQYQWQISSGEDDWADIEGATDADYSVTEPGENSFRCIVKNIGPEIVTYHGGKVENAPSATLEAVTVKIEDETGEVISEEESMEEEKSSELVIEETESEGSAQKGGKLTKLIAKIRDPFTK